METVKLEIELPKEAAELAQGLAAFAATAVKAIKDGWAPGTDIPLIITAAIGDLGPAMAGIANLPEELKEDKAAFAAAFAWAGIQFFHALKA